MSTLSQPTQNVIDHIFTAAYSYTNASGFQVQINTQLDGDVNIGNVATSYDFFLNGLTLSEIIGNNFPPVRWADYPAVNNVNLSGHYITSLSGAEKLTVNVCGGMIVTGDNDFGFSLGIGHLTVAIGNIVTTCGNVAAGGNLTATGNANIDKNITAGGTIKSTGGSIYNPIAFSVNNNSGSLTFNGSDGYYKTNYIGLVTGETTMPSYLFLSVSGSCNVLAGDHLEIMSTNAGVGNPLNLVTYSASGVYAVKFSICDRVLHEYVYFGAPKNDWVELY